jgi:predicted DNA-binding protein
MAEKKNRTLRLPAEVNEQLEAVAEADGMPIAEAVRVAIAAHIDQRRRDPMFQQRLRNSLERHRALLEKLADT